MKEKEELKNYLNNLINNLKELGIYNHFFSNPSFNHVINKIKEEITSFIDKKFIKKVKIYDIDNVFIELSDKSILKLKLYVDNAYPNALGCRIRKIVNEYQSDIDIKYRDENIITNILIDDFNNIYFEKYKVIGNTYKELVSDIKSVSVDAYGLNEKYDEEGTKIERKEKNINYGNMDLVDAMSDIEFSVKNDKKIRSLVD